jgi:hypothetical protein
MGGSERGERENRKHERLALWFPILVDSVSDGRNQAIIADASAGGLLIHKRRRLVVGETVSITIAVPGEPKRFILGRIRRVEDGEHGHRVAIAFVEESPELAAVFKRVVDSAPP